MEYLIIDHDKGIGMSSVIYNSKTVSNAKEHTI